MEISVIVPVYGVERYLRQCVDSILDQTFSDFELILIDDGSPDACPQICDAYARTDVRVRVLHQANGGLSRARNAGIEAARGRWLCFVDSDDWIAKDMLETLHAAAVKNRADMAVCSYVAVDENGTALYEAPPEEPGVITPDQFFQTYVSRKNRVYYTVVWNKIYSRRIFQTLRFPADRIHEDNYILYDAVSSCQRIALTNRTGYYYRHRAHSIMSNPRSVKDLSGPDANLDHAGKSAAAGKWDTAVGFLLLAKGQLLHEAYGDGWEKSAEYRAIKRKAWKLYRLLFCRLSARHKLTVLLFFISEPLAKKGSGRSK